MRSGTLSIRAKFTAVVTVVIGCVVLVLGTLYVYSSVGHLRGAEKEFLSNASGNVVALAYMVAPHFVEHDYAFMNRVVAFEARGSNRDYAALVDNQNRIMAHSTAAQLGGVFVLPGPVRTARSGDVTVQVYNRDGKTFYDVSCPIKAGDLILGTARIGLNSNWIDEEKRGMKQVILEFLVATAALFAVSILMTSVLAKRITGPLLSLTESAEKVGQGDFSHEVSRESRDEVGILANAFSRMLNDLRELRSHLVDKNYVESIISTMNDALIVLSHDGLIRTVNAGALKMLGYGSDELTGQPVETILDEFPFAAELLGEVGRKGFMSGSIEGVLRSKDGRRIPALVSVSPLEGNGAEGIVCVAKDISERKRAEDALRESETKLRTLFESVNDAIFILDTKGNFIDVNKTAYERLGYTKEEMLTKNVAFLDPPEFAVRVPERLERMRELGHAVFESAHIRKDGTVMPVEINARLIDLQGKPMVFSVIRDITERKSAAEKIESALREKEVLLKEVHHRVKNNMQVVSSMLQLQSGYIRDEEAQTAFRESQRRVEAMSLIHDKLYRSHDLAKIDFGQYVEDLVNKMFAFNTGSSDRVEWTLDIEKVMLDVGYAIPCGLIINELVSNSLKHAFRDGGEVGIHIGMHLARGGRLNLVVSDNGTGFPEGLDFRETKTLGLQLVTSLVQQLCGEIALDRTGGTSFKIDFDI